MCRRHLVSFYRIQPRALREVALDVRPHAVQLGNEGVGGDVAGDKSAKALAGVLVHDGGDLHRPSVAQQGVGRREQCVGGRYAPNWWGFERLVV
jgi:hypothetical protein